MWLLWTLLVAAAPLCCALPSGAEVILGNLWVQALSPTLLRVEPKGPRGFSSKGAVLSTEHYNVILTKGAVDDQPSCSKPLSGRDIHLVERAANFPNGSKVASREECCGLCDGDPTCTVWIYKPSALQATLEDVDGANCWPVASFKTLNIAVGNREIGCASRGCRLLRACSSAQPSTDVKSSKRSPAFPDGAEVPDRDACCSLCEDDTSCVAWVFAPGSSGTMNCWSLASHGESMVQEGRELGCPSRTCPPGPAFQVTDPTGVEGVEEPLALAGAAGGQELWPHGLPSLCDADLGCGTCAKGRRA